METTGGEQGLGDPEGLEPAANGGGPPCAPAVTAQGSEPSRLPPRGHQRRLRVLRAPPRRAPRNPAEGPGRACSRPGGQSWRRRRDPRRRAAKHGDAGPRLLAAAGRPGPRACEGPGVPGLREQRREVVTVPAKARRGVDSERAFQFLYAFVTESFPLLNVFVVSQHCMDQQREEIPSSRGRHCLPPHSVNFFSDTFFVWSLTVIVTNEHHSCSRES